MLTIVRRKNERFTVETSEGTLEVTVHSVDDIAGSVRLEVRAPDGRPISWKGFPNSEVRVLVAGETVRVRVHKIERGRASLGIDAPSSWLISRGELRGTRSPSRGLTGGSES